MKYQNLKYFLNKIDEPNRGKCKRLLGDFKERFTVAPGALRKHQAWEGGYIHHLEETMNLGQAFYEKMNSFRKLPFSLSDVILILFLHDLEKPFRYVPVKKEFAHEMEKKDFINSLIKKYKIKLTANHKNALEYVHGEGNDFHRTKRIQKPLAAFVHCLDTISARVWFDEPKKSKNK
jgi:23S rRNA maturation-related 3'-5' exoribonuclease YhaM